MVATTFWSTDSNPMSAAQFLEQMFGDLPEFFKDENELRKIWSQPDTRESLLNSLADSGYGKDQLAEIRMMINAEKSDLFDVLAYVAFALQPITRRERVAASKERIFSQYDDKQQVFLEFVLAQYVKEGVGELAPEKLPDLLALKYHAVSDAAAELGSVASIRDVFVGFQKHLYAEAAP
ncbi:MAG: hypothetical protein IIC55_04890 [Proteobacteria bacterium]|nr:hypothetical protein [Pseudomonadota bacterium]